MRTSAHVGAKWKDQLSSQSTSWFHYALLMRKEKIVIITLFIILEI